MFKMDTRSPDVEFCSSVLMTVNFSTVIVEVATLARARNNTHITESAEIDCIASVVEQNFSSFSI
jgi:hypothetical protein